MFSAKDKAPRKVAMPSAGGTVSCCFEIRKLLFLGQGFKLFRVDGIKNKTVTLSLSHPFWLSSGGSLVSFSPPYNSEKFSYIGTCWRRSPLLLYVGHFRGFSLMKLLCLDVN